MKDNKIWVRARCLDYYKLISKLEYMDVLVYDAKYNGEYIYLLVSKESLERLEKYLVSYKFKVVKKMGLGKLIDFWHDNKIWIVAVVLGLVLMFGLQNMIVKINIVHENQEIRDIIKDELDNYGIKVLSFKKSYAKLNKIRGEILDKHPKTLDWREVEVKGLVMTVRVEERKIVDIEENTKVCDVVASKNGVVSAVQVRAGEAKVNVNDYVRKGDILISGVIKHNEEVKRNVCADGEVYATTWYTVNIKVPYNYNDKYKTGKKKYNIVYKHEGKEKKILKSRYKEYDTNYKKVLDIFDYQIYITREEERKRVVKKRSEEEVLLYALEKSGDSIMVQLQNKGEIIDKKVLKKVVNNSTMDIDVFIIVKELISTTREEMSN